MVQNKDIAVDIIHHQIITKIRTIVDINRLTRGRYE